MTWQNIITLIIAVYGALLSSATFVVQLRSKRWWVVATFSLPPGDRPILLRVRADNLGERPVTLKHETIGLGYRRGRPYWLVRAIHVFAPLYGIKNKQSFGTYGRDSLAVSTVLDPGRSFKLDHDAEDVLDYATSKSRSGDRPADYIVGIFFDDLGRSYPTPVMPVAVLKHHCEFE
jgi:hypothetical protein